MKTEINGPKLDCSTPRRPYMLVVNEDIKAALFFRPRCKLWSCPYCAGVNRGLWAVRMFLGAKDLVSEGYNIDFLTLTSHERLNPKGTLYVWPKAWAKLRTRAYRVVGQFPYVLIPERHADGRLHIHAIETAHLGQTWWKDNARACGLGYMAEEGEIKTPQGAAWYVSKYISKTLEHTDWPKGFRRVRTSQNWPKLAEQAIPEGWLFSTLQPHDSLQDETRRYMAKGYVVKVANSGEAWEWLKLANA